MKGWRRFWDAFTGYGVGGMIGFAVAHFALNISESFPVQVAVLLCLMAALFVILAIVEEIF